MSKKSSLGKIVGGLGLGALVAGVAASYYFAGTEGKKRKKNLEKWSEKAKAEMLEKLKQMGEVSKQAYEQAAKQIVQKYKDSQTISPTELSKFGKELMNHWKSISKKISNVKKPTTKKPSKKSK